MKEVYNFYRYSKICSQNLKRYNFILINILIVRQMKEKITAKAAEKKFLTPYHFVKNVKLQFILAPHAVCLAIIDGIAINVEKKKMKK